MSAALVTLLWSYDITNNPNQYEIASESSLTGECNSLVLHAFIDHVKYIDRIKIKL